jgi:NitT/TauT family transport system substrate-binding protein
MARKRTLVTLLLVLGLAAAACGGGGKTPAASDGATADAGTIRLGHFPNVTHATAIVGVEKGIFQKHLGETKVDVKTFNAGGDAVTAIVAEQLDATYVGPNPAINAYAKEGKAIRIISGATSGGAFLVVKPEITKPEDLAPVGDKRKVIASPQLGNTQDVALRAWLKEKGYETTATGGGDVEVKPQENAQSLETFKSGLIDGAWVPEPWATRLVQEGGGKVLVDERDLWPNGRYVTTHLIVRTKYLDEHPDQVKALLEAHLEADDFIRKNADEAKQLVNRGIEKITSKPIADKVLDAAWENLTFTVDPVSSSLQKSADEAIELKLLDPVDLKGIYDLEPLNALLKAAGREEVDGF